ncbi:hypothetical protein MN116_004874 [Schistosoma mekongi]|uniref:HAUS augmin-like complex subunit 6 N-terminal domain-containing protein n=1 Tax=Schistosoma mekongi TaxID=38744 RepID=A0AAE2D4W2_SCHME|nr:hypothetical protein MN116_004874 [Schistosoma mekongi]
MAARYIRLSTMPRDSKYLLLRYSSVVLRNLNLLDYDFSAYNVPKQIKLFVSYFKIPRKIEFIHILHFLFRTLNPEKYNSDLCTFLGPNSEVGFKNAVYRWLRILSSEFPRIISNFFAIWGFPAGVGVMRFLANLSSYVLITSNDLRSFVKRCVENNSDPEWLPFCSIKNIQLDLKRSFSYIRSEEILQRELLKGCEVLDSEVQRTLEELSKSKELVLSDPNLQEYVGNVNLYSLCFDKTVEPPEELIAYQIQLEKEVFTLKQQLENYLNRYKPSLILLNDILNSLNDRKLYTLNGADMKFLHTRNICLPDLNGNNMEDPKQIDGKLNFRLFLRHSTLLLQMACKSYNSCFTNDVLGELVALQLSSPNQHTSSDCLKVFRQAVNNLHSKTPIDSAYSIQSEDKLCLLKEEMQSTIDELQLKLKDEWLYESQRTLHIPKFSQTSSSIPEPFTLYKTRTEDDVNGNFNEIPELSMGSILNEISETLPITPTSVGFSQSVQISSHQLYKNSPTRCNFQHNLLGESIHKLSTSPPNYDSVYDSTINLCNMKSTYTTSSSSSSSCTVSEHYDTPYKLEEIKNVTQSLSKSLSKNVIRPDKLYDDSSSYQHLLSSSVIMTTENKVSTLGSPDYFKSASNMDFPVTISPSKSISKEPLNNLPSIAASTVSTHTHHTSVSSDMKLNESLSSIQSYGSFNLLDDNLEFVNDLIPSSPN